MGSRPDCIVVGAGHNGLICACYLARAGRRVLVLERSDRPGGGSRTEETVPGYRFDTHSAAHNIINMTSIPDELALAEVGLDYREMDPFAVAVFADGRRVRFHRSIERTVASIAETDRAEAEAYRALMELAVPLVEVATAGLALGGGPRPLARSLLTRRRALWALVPRLSPRLVGELLGPYGSVLEGRLGSDLTRGPIAAFAAHAGAGPATTGGGAFALWQAAYHRFGQWHSRGGSGGLTAALVRRLTALGGELRCGAEVARIDGAAGRARGVELIDGERVEAPVVITALHPRHALLGLLDPPLAGAAGTALRATHASNAVQAIVHVAADRLPPYADAREGDWNGLQSFVDGLDQLRAGFAAAEAGRLHHPAPAYAFTTSALDDGLAPPGHHTVYLACPCAPAEIQGSWDEAGERLAEDLIDQVESRAPGFRASIQGVAVRTPPMMAEELGWPGAHPMHLDVTPDQIGPLRPVAALGDHRTPVTGLYITGAGTAPVGGVAGAPGRAAARAVLKDA
ncbi:MAG: phytoene desaturase family protein [Solirubrobacterales bacterium]